METERLDRDEQADLEAELIESQIEVYTGEDGTRACTRCRRVLHGDDFYVSLMGHGLYCNKRVECAARAVEILRDNSEDRDVKCERCRQGQRGHGFRVVSNGTVLVCANAEDCQARVVSLVKGG